MKKFYLSSIFLSLVFMLFSCQQDKLKSAAKYQQDLKSFYENPQTNPLTEAERKNFKGISFFPLAEKYVLKATFTPVLDGAVIEMPTSAQKIKYYKTYGYFYFTIDGQELKLTAFVLEPVNPENPNHIFIPFKDATNGKTSYGAGRYLDLEKTDIVQGRTILDFNKAYNPYCAYSEAYNCPIPPQENILPIAIEAGVRLSAAEH